MKKKKMMKQKIAAGSKSIISSTIEANDVVLVVELTEDLILEIFSHLPPISVLRFKSISKTWYSLISNPDFLCRNTDNQFDKRWHSINDHPSSIILKRYQFAGDSRILTFPPPPPNDYDQLYYYFHQKVSPSLLQKLIDYRPEHDYDQHDQVYGTDEKGKFWLIDSCNGLLLYRNSVEYGIPPTRKYNLYICNPITHDYIKLPTFEEEEREQGFKICNYALSNIVFDPSVSLTYKVVIWLRCTTTIDHKTISSSNLIHLKEEEEEHYRFYVYSSITRSWRLSISTNQFPVRVRLGFIQRGVLCNGVLYWRGICPFFHNNDSLRYDVEKDVISTLNFPKMPLEFNNRVLLYLGECGGRLRLIEIYYKESHPQLLVGGGMIDVFPSIFDVMELDNNDDLWTVKYRVNMGEDQVGYYAELIRKYRPPEFDVHILDLYKTKTKKGEHEIEEEELLLNISNICIIPFNLSSNTFGKELLLNKSQSDRSYDCMGFTEALQYNTITLFPLSSSSSISNQ